MKIDYIIKITRFYSSSSKVIDPGGQNWPMSYSCDRLVVLVSHRYKIQVNIGSINDLLSAGTKPIPEAMLTYNHQSPYAFIRRQFH